MKQAVVRRLTPKAREAIEDKPAASLFAFCFSLWGDDPLHQCVRGRHHNGKCRCACGAER